MKSPFVDKGWLPSIGARTMLGQSSFVETLHVPFEDQFLTQGLAKLAALKKLRLWKREQCLQSALLFHAWLILLFRPKNPRLGKSEGDRGKGHKIPPSNFF